MPEPGPETSVPYVSGTGGYPVYRIPAVVRTAGGVLLAFAEGRSGTGDSGAIDLVLRRSGDGGRTWSPLQVVAAGGGDTVGNPVPIALPGGPGDRVVLLSTRNAGAVTERDIVAGLVPEAAGRRVFVSASADGGETFTAPREITASVKRPGWRWYATGPGHGLALTRGRYAGRLLAPANHSGPGEGPGSYGGPSRYGGPRYGGHCLHSDDAGRTWRIGFVDPGTAGYLHPNETAAAELPDGRIYLGTRNQGGSAPGTRGAAYSADGGDTLVAPYRPEPALVTPVVQGSLLAVPGPPGRRAALLYSGPADSHERRRMAIRVSHDAGRTWRTGLVVSELPAGYSDLVPLDAGTVGLLYEMGRVAPHETIAFSRIPLDAVLDPTAR